MQIFVMNLDRAPERLEEMCHRFSQAGLSFERVPAVDGNALTPEEIDRVLAGVGRWGRLTPGEIGCFLSHRRCWSALLESGERFGAIFEDDIVLGRNSAAVLAEDGWLPDDAEIVKLETTSSRVYLDRSGAGMVDDRQLYRLRSSHYCAAGYIVSRDCATRLLAASETFHEALDDFLFSVLSPVFQNTRIYQLTPAVCAQKWHASGGGNAQDPNTSIEGRESKQRCTLPLVERLREVCVKEGMSAQNKLLVLWGRRQRLPVEFR
ncbi:glycosyltransferase family 25 protein [Nitratireductor sp. GISD-1A_MAKvit]|uniref:glycosyltransferase family 25 protein n=1 Tax=Nitratireductor sp. GISD-1A_MAKvit TaxID=3234198 RepID=UPI003466ABA6